RHRFMLAHCYQRLGIARQQQANPEVWQQFIKALSPLVTEYAGVAQYRGDLAHGYLCLGDALSDKPERAAAYRQAIDLGAAVVRESPDVIWYRQNLAESHANLADLLWEKGEMDKAAEYYRLARAVHEELAQRFPDSPK